MTVAGALSLPGLEVPPMSLRLDVNVWGLDVSTRRIALGVIQGHGQDAPEAGWFSLEVAQRGGGASRLAGLHPTRAGKSGTSVEALRAFFERIAGTAWPSAVLVEQPFGQGKARPHPQSYYMVGVVLYELAALFDTYGPVDVVEPSSWKRDAMGEGHGFAKKPEILSWAQRVAGYSGECPTCESIKRECDNACRAHDEADCLGIATCAAVRYCAGDLR